GTTSGGLGLGAITDDGALAFNRSDTVSGVLIGGAGAVAQNGSGTLFLTGAQTYTGHTYANNGTLRIGDGAATTSLVPDQLLVSANALVTLSSTVNTGLV